MKKGRLGGEKRKISFTLGNSREGMVTTTGIITKVSSMMITTVIIIITKVRSMMITTSIIIITKVRSMKIPSIIIT